MIEQPALARALIAYEAPDDSVILASPFEEFVLSGKVYSLLIPLLDGVRSADAIAELLSDRIDPAEVYYALLCLEAEACITEGPCDAVARAFDANDHLLHPITGIARGVKKLAIPNLTTAHVYIAGLNQASLNSRLNDVTRHLRSFISGKGQTDSLARASLIGEAAERHSAVYRGDEQTIHGSYADLRDLAIHPNNVMLYSERQFEMREALATEDDPIPRRLDSNETIPWSPVWSLTGEREKFAPTSLLYFDAPSASGGSYCFADSNGNAAGATREAAMLQGLLELVERDAAGIWWFNSVRRPHVPLEQVDDEWINEFVAELSQIGREVWVLDISTDFSVPVYAAVSHRIEGAEHILFGFGAHLDEKIAIVRALTELGQTLAVMNEIETSGAPMRAGLRNWLESATLQTCEFLRPSGNSHFRSTAPIGSPEESLAICRTRIEKLGFECLVLDQTRPDVGVPVVKMLVPGLRHYRRRYGTGRLYSTPVEMGWQPRARSEDQLNPLVLSF